jgi:MFS family permease
VTSDHRTLSRSITAVLFGTFSLRFSTGLTGTMLGVYLAHLEEHGGPRISGLEVGLLTALYFLSELILSPPFGALSDRLGSHRVMQWGPVFGAVAVIMTAVTTHSLLVPVLGAVGILVWLGVTRLLEGAAAGASIPSILGYIAAATSHDEALRGRAVSRFEAATLIGLGLGVVSGPALFERIGPLGFLLNAGIYVISFVIYRYGVGELRPADVVAARRSDTARERFDVGRYLELLRSSVVWLLAPTWISLNAVIGSWTSQSVFQLAKEPNPRFAAQLINGGIAPSNISIGAAVGLVVFLAGLVYWGNRFKRYRRTTIIGFGIAGGFVMLLSGAAINHSQPFPFAVVALLVLALLGGLFVLAGATPAALGLLADITEAHPEDRGAMMGLYSVFLGLGQIIGSALAGLGADLAGFDGLLAVSLALLAIAVVPLGRLRASEHIVDAHGQAGRRRGDGEQPPSEKQPPRVLAQSPDQTN